MIELVFDPQPDYFNWFYPDYPRALLDHQRLGFLGTETSHRWRYLREEEQEFTTWICYTRIGDQLIRIEYVADVLEIMVTPQVFYAWRRIDIIRGLQGDGDLSAILEALPGRLLLAQL